MHDLLCEIREVVRDEICTALREERSGAWAPKAAIAEKDNGIRLFTVEQVAERLSVTPATVRDWISSGKLVAVRLGASRHYRIRSMDLEAFVEMGAPRVKGGEDDVATQAAKIVQLARDRCR